MGKLVDNDEPLLECGLKHLQNYIGMADPSVFNALISVWEMKPIFGRGVRGSNDYVCWFSINAIFVRKPARFGKDRGEEYCVLQDLNLDH